MLYMIGAVQIDTFPFSIDGASENQSAQIARKAVMGGIEPGEFTGFSGRSMTLSGQILPLHIGGLSELEMITDMMNTGAVVPVLRGDGERLGNFSIEKVSQSHSELGRDGIGHVVAHTIGLQQQPDEAPVADDLIPNLLSLFRIS